MTTLKSSFVLMLQLFPRDFLQNCINTYTLKHHGHKLIMCPFPDISEHWSCPATSNIRTNDCRCWALSWKSCMTIKIQFPMFDFWSSDYSRDNVYNLRADLWQPEWLQLFGCSNPQVNFTFYVCTPKKSDKRSKTYQRFLFWMIAGIRCYSDLITSTYAVFMVLWRGPALFISKIKASHKGKGKTFILIVILPTFLTGICQPSCTLSNMRL